MSANNGELTETILDEAARIVNGPRRDSYGDVAESFGAIAQTWTIALRSVLQDGASITPEQVALCMIGLKFCRECNRHGRDNLVDLSAYAHLRQQIILQQQQ